MSEGSGVGDSDAAGSTGRAAHRSRPEPAADDASAPTSAPWERPRTWSASSALEPTRVDDLLARLGEPDDGPESRRGRRRSQGAHTVPASELLAAMAPEDAETDPAAETDPPVEADPPAAPPTHDDPAEGEPASGDPARVARPAQDDPGATAETEGAVAAILASAGSSPIDLFTHRSQGSDPDESDERTEALPTVAAGATAGADTPPAAGPDASPTADAFPEQPDRTDPDDLADPTDPPDRGEPTDAPDPGEPAMPAAADAAGAGVTRTGILTRTGIIARVRAPRQFPNRPRGAWLYAGRGVAAVLAVIVLAAFGINWKILDRARIGLAATEVAAINTADSNIVRATPTTAADSAAPTTGGSSSSADGAGDGGTVPVVAPVKTYPAENILLLGSDTRANGNGNAGNSDGNEGSAQSDTLMIAHLSADRQHVTIVSIPRDTKVDAPTCKKWDQVTGKLSTKTQPVSPGDRWSITNAYAVGGPTCTVAAVQKLTGLQIDRLLGVTFNGFKAMVDALGGVTVDICKPIVDAELQTVAPSAGVQVIHGDQALSLVRARKVIGDQQSDLARIHRQQIVLSAILRQVSSAGTLLNPAKLDNFLQAFTKNTFNSNITLDDLVTLADSLGDLSPDRVTFYTLPTLPDPADSDSLVLDESKAPAVFAALRNDTPLPGEVPVTPTPTPSRTPPVASPPSTATSRSPAAASPTPAEPTTISVDPGRIALDVVNLSGRAGVGGEVQAALNAEGFGIADERVTQPGNGDQEPVTVQYSGANRAAALTVAAAVPGAVVMSAAGLGSRVRLMVGTSYQGKIVPVRLGQALPASLVPSASSSTASTSTDSSPASSSVFDAFGSLASASAVPAPSGSGGGSSATGPAATLKASDLSAVNAGSQSCA